jgi:glyoxylase-like metal-dependent hydrolase (beta-lactamase superfamily II)
MKRMSEIREVAENIYLIDAEQEFIPNLTAAYFVNEDRKALVDTGPPNSATAILQGIKRLGVDPKEVSHIVVTHIHLDHAGGAGTLIKEMPHAKVLVHPKGARHLIDPSKLMAGVTWVMGQEMLMRYGSMVPIEPERVEAVEDGVVIELSSQQTLKVVHTPGHANHHLCLYEERNKGLFTGDAIGMYFAEAEFLFPETLPHDFDLRLALESIEKVRKLPLEIVYFSHFGTSTKPNKMLQMARDGLNFWSDLVYEARNDHLMSICEKVKEAIFSLRGDELEVVQQDRGLYAVEKLLPVGVAGYLDYFRRVSEGKVNRAVQSN